MSARDSLGARALALFEASLETPSPERRAWIINAARHDPAQLPRFAVEVESAAFGCLDVMPDDPGIGGHVLDQLSQLTVAHLPRQP